jgi:hypothetical protein
MEIPVAVQQTESNRFRAWCVEPVEAEGEGATQADALDNIQVALAAKLPHVSVVRVVGRLFPAQPIWPDDEFTRAWLEGIAEARRITDATPDPWDVP